MTQRELPINPYAPSMVNDSADAGADPDRPGEPAPSIRRRSIGWTAVCWLLVCGLSAIPSLIYGISLTGGRLAGMILGIFIFAVGYTVVDYRTALRPWRQRRRLRRTLRIAYGTRVLISTVIPIGLYLDMFCGLISISLTQSLTGYEVTTSGEMSFGIALLTTLVQGVVLNVVLAGFAFAVHAFQLIVGKLRS